MKITRLAVQHVRIHTLKTLNLEPGTTLISGPNGSGKTSLIEAIHIALRGTSFRGSDEAVCQHEQKSYTIDLATDEQHYRVQYDRRHETKRKRFIVDGTTYGRLPYGKKYPIVLFEPDTLRVITGSPQRRRDFLDTLIQQYDAHYSHELSRYHRALQQRNKLLKDPALSDATLFSWNLILSQYGASIITKRQRVLRYLNTKSSAMYQSIAGVADSVALHYSEERSVTAQQLIAEYEQKTAYDTVVGATSVGPHRHDITVLFRGNLAAKTASRGEIRTIVLALKFLEAAYIQQQTGQAPLILLDDVFGELDQQRQQRLLSEFVDNQIVMTSAVG